MPPTDGRPQMRCSRMKIYDTVQPHLVVGREHRAGGAVCGVGQCAAGADLADGSEHSSTSRRLEPTYWFPSRNIPPITPVRGDHEEIGAQGGGTCISGLAAVAGGTGESSQAWAECQCGNCSPGPVASDIDLRCMDLQALWLTLRLAVGTTAILLVIALPLAWWIASGRGLDERWCRQ